MDLHERIDAMAKDVVDLKVVAAKQEVNLAKSNEILDRLTSSVEEHVKRSDATDKAVALLQASLENKKENDKLVLTVLAGVGAVLLALKELGILDKLM